MRVLFTPFGESNPYLELLKRHLAMHGIAPIGLPSFKEMVAVARRKKVSAFHLQWLHPYASGGRLKSWMRPPRLILNLIILRLLGVRIVWTVHNLQAHEQRGRRRELCMGLCVARLAHAVIVHGEIAKTLACKRFHIPEHKCHVIPHGNYIEWYSNEIGRQEARRRLGLANDHRVGLFLGNIRPYKGIDELFRAFRQLPGEHLRLIVAGKVTSRAVNWWGNTIADDRRLIVHEGYVADDNVQLYMNAADFAVYPYRDVLTSGAVLLGMSFGKACVAVRRGCISETLNAAGAFLYDADDEYGLYHMLYEAFTADHDRLEEMGKANLQIARELDWDSIASRLVPIYTG